MPKAAQLLSGPHLLLPLSVLLSTSCVNCPVKPTSLPPWALPPHTVQLSAPTVTSQGHSLTMTLTLSQPFPSLLSETPVLALSMQWCLT